MSSNSFSYLSNEKIPIMPTSGLSKNLGVLRNLFRNLFSSRLSSNQQSTPRRLQIREKVSPLNENHRW